MKRKINRKWICAVLSLVILVLNFSTKGYATEKDLTGITVYYTGGPLMKGSRLTKDKITVMAKYNDGSFKEVGDYVISDTYIYQEGDNLIHVIYGEGNRTFNQTFYVTGYVIRPGETYNVFFVSNGGSYVAPITDIAQLSRIQLPLVSRTGYWFRGWYTEPELRNPFTEDTIITRHMTLYAKWEQKTQGNVLSDIVGVGFLRSTITVDVTGQKYGSQINMETSSLNPESIKRAVNMIADTKKYIGFILDMKDYTFSKQTPLPVTMTIPDGFDVKKCGVFYSTNGKSVMGKLHVSFRSSNVVEFYAYEPGIYILMECEDSPLTTDQTVDQSYIVLEEPVEVVTVAEQAALLPRFYNFMGEENQVKLLWESSNRKILQVDEQGIITGKSPGRAFITVHSKDNLYYANCEVLVTIDGELIESIKLNATKKVLKKGQKFQMKATIVPRSAEFKKLRYTSMNKKVATVTTSGKVTARKKGSCYIYVETLDGSELYKIVKITVK